MNIFVGNLAFEAREADLRKLFEVFGEVGSIKLLMHKKGIKNRGFGFVEMPDDSRAQAAMSNLSGQEFMGRVLKLSPARPRPEKVVEVVQRKEKHHGFSPEGRNFHYEEGGRRDTGFKPEFPKPGTYKGGRRSRSFLARNPEARQDENFSSRRPAPYNPMRWTKKSEQVKPWHKPREESKPWHRASGESKPWHKKTTGDAKPWHKPRGEAKPWERDRVSTSPARRIEGAAKPWHKSRGEVKPWERDKAGARLRRTEGASAAKPWRKPRGEYKPWEKAKASAGPAAKSHGPKPWHKTERPRPKTGFRARKRA
ncbi:MAG: RNA-binding protein [Candidatus Omnitrophota bacterium]